MIQRIKKQYQKPFNPQILIFFFIFLFFLTGFDNQAYSRHTHKTAKNGVVLPSLQKNALNFFVISDWGRNGFYNQTEVGESMAQTGEILKPNFIVSCGDNFQVNGVQSTSDPLWLSNFENIYKHPALLVDWYPVLGNHDYRGNTQAEIDYSKISRRWKMPAHYYSMVKKTNDGTSVKLIFLDTTPLIKEYHQNADLFDVATQDTTAQLKWLKDELQNSHERWIIVFGHHPVFSANKSNDSSELAQKIGFLLSHYNVDFYICGHIHNFQHLRQKGSKVDYLITGTGSKITDKEKHKGTLFEMAVPGFSCLSVSQKSISVFFMNTNNEVIYSYQKNK